MSGYGFTEGALERIQMNLRYAAKDLDGGYGGGPPEADAGESSEIVGRAIVTVSGFALAMAQQLSLSAQQINTANGVYNSIENATAGEMEANRQLAAMGADGSSDYLEHSGPLLDAGQNARHDDRFPPRQNGSR